MVSPQVSNLAIMLVMMQVSKKVPFEDPTVLNGVRGLYIAANVILASIYYYIGTQIERKKEKSVLKYTESPSLGSTEPKEVTTTIYAYDRAQVGKLWNTMLIGVAMIGFMHLYMKFTNPLLIQSILIIKGALESNLAKVHLFGKPATGDLKRPWKEAPSLFSSGAGESKNEKKSISSASESGRGQSGKAE